MDIAVFSTRGLGGPPDLVAHLPCLALAVENTAIDAAVIDKVFPSAGLVRAASFCL
jgi:hypothetical protein